MTPTGKSFAMGAIDVFTFDDAGMNTEHYGVYDIMGTMGQLGLLPEPELPPHAASVSEPATSSTVNCRNRNRVTTGLLWWCAW